MITPITQVGCISSNAIMTREEEEEFQLSEGKKKSRPHEDGGEGLGGTPTAIGSWKSKVFLPGFQWQCSLSAPRF